MITKINCRFFVLSALLIISVAAYPDSLLGGVLVSDSQMRNPLGGGA
jgi:hypothetical protein